MPDASGFRCTPGGSGHPGGCAENPADAHRVGPKGGSPGGRSVARPSRRLPELIGITTLESFVMSIKAIAKLPCLKHKLRTGPWPEPGRRDGPPRARSLGDHRRKGAQADRPEGTGGGEDRGYGRDLDGFARALVRPWSRAIYEHPSSPERIYNRLKHDLDRKGVTIFDREKIARGGGLLWTRTTRVCSARSLKSTIFGLIPRLAYLCERVLDDT